MLTDNISPNTIDGIKSLAKAIKKREGIKHAEALDQAALQAGYSNFRKAMALALKKPVAANLQSSKTTKSSRFSKKT